MTDTRALSPDEEADVLAAEYVLGVLALDERLAAEARIKSDPAFAAHVAAWETHFEALNDEFSSLPAPDLMPKIEARIFGRNVAPKRNWWRFITGAGVAAALALAVVMIVPPSSTPPGLTASLAGEAQELAYNASYTDGNLTIDWLAGPPADAGHDYELWVIVGDAAPLSLGVVKGTTTTRALASLQPGSVLAITLEPTGGSASGAPTGPVLVKGVIVAS